MLAYLYKGGRPFGMKESRGSKTENPGDAWTWDTWEIKCHGKWNLCI